MKKKKFMNIFYDFFFLWRTKGDKKFKYLHKNSICRLITIESDHWSINEASTSYSHCLFKLEWYHIVNYVKILILNALIIILIVIKRFTCRWCIWRIIKAACYCVFMCVDGDAQKGFKFFFGCILIIFEKKSLMSLILCGAVVVSARQLDALWCEFETFYWNA